MGCFAEYAAYALYRKINNDNTAMLLFLFSYHQSLFKMIVLADYGRDTCVVTSGSITVNTSVLVAKYIYYVSVIIQKPVQH